MINEMYTKFQDFVTNVFYTIKACVNYYLLILEYPKLKWFKTRIIILLKNEINIKYLLNNNYQYYHLDFLTTLLLDNKIDKCNIKKLSHEWIDEDKMRYITNALLNGIDNIFDYITINSTTDDIIKISLKLMNEEKNKGDI